MKTLITGGKSAQALKLLKAFTADQVILADYGEIPSYASAQYQFISLGERNDEIVAHNLLNTCLDQGIERLLPIYNFEVEAVAKSAILFEEFNIHVLLPDIHTFSTYPLTGAVNKQNWAIYNKGELLYAALQETDLQDAGKAKSLNGAFYMEETQHPILFTIA